MKRVGNLSPIIAADAGADDNERYDLQISYHGCVGPPYTRKHVQCNSMD